MSITNELREWVKTLYTPCSDELKREAERIADNIDEEHEREVTMACGEAVAKLGNKVAREYVKLPVDADGKVIHIGDVMEVEFDTKRRPFTVSFVSERAVAFWVDGQPDLKSFNLDTVLVIHHHEPTVEDLLLDFAQEMNENLDMYTNEGVEEDEWCDADAKTVAKYAKKLRLAGEDA